MRLVEIDTRNEDGARTLIGVVQTEGGARFATKFEYSFTGGCPPAPCIAEPFAAAMLLPAMQAGEPLQIDVPIDRRLHFNLPRVRDIFRSCWPHLHRVNTHTQALDKRQDSGGSQLASFFSCGVDSFYTLLKHLHTDQPERPPISHIIFMSGLESRLARAIGAQQAEARARRVADVLGINCIVGRTDIRDKLQGSNDDLSYAKQYHGSVCAGVALSLADQFGYVCIPTAFTYGYTEPHGSTAIEMYSTDNTYIIHDGAEATRCQKVAKILEWNRDIVLNNLRVCVKNRAGDYNCGKCHKCVRTAIDLFMLGAWDDAVTFPDKSRDHWVSVISRDHAEFTGEQLKMAVEIGADRALIAMLKQARRRGGLLDFVRGSRLRGLLPVARRLRGLAGS